MKMKKVVSVLLAVALCLTLANGISAKKANDDTAVREITGAPSDFTLNYSSQAEMLSQMTKVCENKSFVLYLHEPSLAVAVLDKQTGKAMFTNPYNAALDSYYSGEVAEQLDSQLIVNYIGATDNVKYKFYSSTDSVKFGQYSVKLYDDGIAVDYSIGEEHDVMVAPPAILKEDFDEISEDMDESDIETFETFYSLADLADEDDFLTETYVEEYPFAKGKKVYITSQLNSREQKQIDKIMRSAGFDEAKYNELLKKYGIKVENELFPNIKLTLKYDLTDTGVKVTIPRDSIKFDTKVCNLESIDLLPFFGADSELTGNKGYLFIPDGSGAKIDFANQNENRRRIIKSRVYGYDKALDFSNFSVEGNQFYLPVFGTVRNDDTALFAVVTEGDTLCNITAQLGAPNSNYYTDFASFLYTTVEEIKRTPKVNYANVVEKVYISDKNVSDDDMSIDYYILSGDKANYSAMADVYRAKLIADGMKEKEQIRKLGVKTIGTALYEDSFIGITYKREAEFTSFDDNFKIVKYLNENGADNVSLTLDGWQKYGLDAGLSTKFNPSSTLGGKKGFEKLLGNIKDNNTDLYLTVGLVGTRYDRLFDGYSKKRDTVKRIDRKYANLSEYDVSTQTYLNDGFLLSPTRYDDVILKMSKSYAKYDGAKLNLSSFGSQLNSDFNTGNSINRYETKQVLEKNFASLCEKRTLAFEGANAYILPYATEITNVPLSCSSFSGETASVPFVQLVISGCVDCYSPAINLSASSKVTLLDCIAAGVSPYYIFAYDNIELLKLTNYTNYYAIGFDTMKESAIEGYTFVKEALEKTENSRLVSHEAINSDVALAHYENGTNIYVNKGTTDYTVGSTVVPAMGYTVM